MNDYVLKGCLPTPWCPSSLMVSLHWPLGWAYLLSVFITLELMVKVFLFWVFLLGKAYGQLDSVPNQKGSSIVILESSSRAGAAPRVFEKPENAAGFLRRGGQRITLGLGLGLAGPTLALIPLAFSSNSETTLPFAVAGGVIGLIGYGFLFAGANDVRKAGICLSSKGVGLGVRF